MRFLFWPLNYLLWALFCECRDEHTPHLCSWCRKNKWSRRTVEVEEEVGPLYTKERKAFMDRKADQRKKANVFEMEKYMIPSEVWSDEILSNFPPDVRKFLEEGGVVGLGHHNKAGWFCLASGQGPHIVWVENE